MEGGQPRVLGASVCTFAQHSVEFNPGPGQAVWDNAAGYSRAGCCQDVLRCNVTYYTIVPS